MVQFMIFLIVMTVVALGWRRIARQKKARLKWVARREVQNNYHCVEVCAGTHTCGAAQQLEHVRYLSDEAPDLPVAGCRVQICTCRYVHYDDRREDDRRNPRWPATPMPTATASERRSRAERRQSQDNSFKPFVTY